MRGSASGRGESSEPFGRPVTLPGEPMARPRRGPITDQARASGPPDSGWLEGDVVQIDPAHDDLFGGCFMQITEPKTWGAQGFVVVPGRGWAYYRCPHDAMVLIGRAEWIPPSDDPADPAEVSTADAKAGPMFDNTGS